MQAIQDQMPVSAFAEGVGDKPCAALINKDFWRPTRVPIISSTRSL